jgi:hypothetical protein
MYPKCFVKLDSNAMYYDHMMKHIKKNNKESLSSVYFLHKSNTTYTFKCSTCLRDFKFYSSLIEHLPLHSGELNDVSLYNKLYTKTDLA